MKINVIAAGLALVSGLVAAAPVVAQGHAYGHYKHGDRYEDDGRYERPRYDDHRDDRERGDRHGYARPYGYTRHYAYARPHGYARPSGYRPYGYGYHRSRVVCRYRFGQRRCFSA